LLDETAELRKPPEKRNAEKFNKAAEKWRQQNPEKLEKLLAFD